ncbi:MAG: hypothetical protein S4CHLAM20_03360 [Chlamydiia bacterium]|nr:hypothetical protein [Chlamydiia bacterium]
MFVTIESLRDYTSTPIDKNTVVIKDLTLNGNSVTFSGVSPHMTVNGRPVSDILRDKNSQIQLGKPFKADGVFTFCDGVVTTDIKNLNILEYGSSILHVNIDGRPVIYLFIERLQAIILKEKQLEINPLEMKRNDFLTAQKDGTPLPFIVCDRLCRIANGGKPLSLSRT